MGILEKLFIIFIFIFPAGELARIQFSNGVAVSVNDIALLILITFWLLIKTKVKKNKNRYFLLKPIGLFLFIGTFSLLLNFLNLGINWFLISFSYLLRFLGYACLYFIVKDFAKIYKLKINLYLLISGAIVVFIGYVQYFLYPNLKSLFIFGWDEHLYRMVSVFLDPNFAGAFFSMFFIFSLEFFRKNFLKIFNFKNVFIALIPLFSLISVYLTYSRSALIMLFISFIAYLILLRKRNLIFAAVLILTVLIFVSPRAFQTEGTNLLRTVSSNARINSLQVSIKIIQENPLFGVGFNAYRYAQNKIGLNNIYWQITHSGAGTDTSLLFVIATTGIVGFIFYLFLLYKIFILSIRNLNRNGIVLFSVLLGLIVDSFFINSLFYVLILEWIWILSGITENS